MALLRAPGVGPATFRVLLDRFAAPQEVFNAPRAQLEACGLAADTLRYLDAPDWGAVEQDLAWLARPGNHLLTLRDPGYPRLMREIPDPPPLLFVHGDADALATPQLAVVGSRNPTPAGRETAHDFAAYLATAGLTISSGLAVGIDAASHRGALDADGLTIAVTGTGLDRVYPAQHAGLAREIAARGALISEFPPGTPARPEHFPRRNRLISGLSLGVLVVEAAVHSGSLITARHALEQGREVFAIPGSIHNPLARGCHALIRQGAKLVETVADIMEELGPVARVAAPAAHAAPQESSEPELDADYRRLLDAMGFAPTPVDALVERTGLTPEAVSSMLLILELRGYAVSAAGGLYTRVTKRA
ncbi:MAG: DNA-processing protein DprA [Gammaproteobacteria bacterium]|nr:DNA-processing protein DprA [Gammaproteobacteria bacterium]